ncbi:MULTISPECIES: hypothetical protein [Yersinia]|uniref:Uncharacterized protein n=1 Tax=Yersinia pekkanenii TaxID=1288385 RepID=A0A0T9RHL5_9GAMM|nr:MULTISPECIES: hypothetical protein [Yersinia]CFR00983.1 Uncharacterised protein [Yersinia pseudotuberculosis]CNI63231.1 Uncharacterised protein [Yersinia pekkanenii]CRY69546.1 Uncharacterised protein [Yersinia pekkanenii]
MKEYVIPVILVLATVISITVMALFLMGLMGEGIDIGGMTYYLS